jgi:hypothetical protein
VNLVCEWIQLGVYALLNDFGVYLQAEITKLENSRENIGILKFYAECRIFQTAFVGRIAMALNDTLDDILKLFEKNCSPDHLLTSQSERTAKIEIQFGDIYIKSHNLWMSKVVGQFSESLELNLNRAYLNNYSGLDESINTPSPYISVLFYNVSKEINFLEAFHMKEV